MIICGMGGIMSSSKKTVHISDYRDFSDGAQEVIDMLTTEELKLIDEGLTSDYPEGVDVDELDDMLSMDFDNYIGVYIGKTLSEIENGSNTIDYDYSDYD